ncbi:MAG: hypothetical protein E6G78_17520 [Alphaproteobacteria bacterium]|nr:MAG: hypothetical protein E6G78_17520 [Alphaproteobacteria bacterium]
MSFANRREFLRASGAAAFSAAVPADLFAQSVDTPMPSGPAWDPGSVRHLLPTVSHNRILVKASFNAQLPSVPTLRVGETSVAGRMSDTRGEFWHFHVTDLRPARTYQLSIVGNQGRPLCEPWELATFPAPDERPGQFRVLFFSCAGGHEAMKFLPPAVRNRLFRRALSFQPQAAVANGDHVYWDLLSPLTSKRYGASAEAEKIAGKFDRAGIVLGGDNETILKRAVDPQIAPIYGADFRSTPMFFVQDDHDYFDNDEATDDIITFPPTHFMLQLARATQVMYYPEFLPDVARPRGLPWSSAADRPDGVSETFGTIRYGRLAEILLYDIRRTMTLAGPSAVYVDPQAEKWLMARMTATDVVHVVHAPSNPPGWSAGKWGEWYPDILGPDRKLTTSRPKPYWQPGWLKQHDRLMAAMSAMKGRIPLVVSGDMHSIALGTMLGSGALDLKGNPIHVALPGTIGTWPGGWPSVGIRGTPATPSAVLEFEEQIKPIEQHGFILADFTQDKIVLRFFTWDVKAQPVEAIDMLQPFHIAEFSRPA